MLSYNDARHRRNTSYDVDLHGNRTPCSLSGLIVHTRLSGNRTLGSHSWTS